MMALSEDDKREIREEVRQGLKDHFREYQGMEIREHAADHEFLCSLRKSVGTVRKVSLATATGIIVSAVLGLIWLALTSGGK